MPSISPPGQPFTWYDDDLATPFWSIRQGKQRSKRYTEPEDIDVDQMVNTYTTTTKNWFHAFLVAITFANAVLVGAALEPRPRADDSNGVRIWLRQVGWRLFLRFAMDYGMTLFMYWFVTVVFINDWVALKRGMGFMHDCALYVAKHYNATDDWDFGPDDGTNPCEHLRAPYGNPYGLDTPPRLAVDGKRTNEFMSQSLAFGELGGLWFGKNSKVNRASGVDAEEYPYDDAA